MKMEIDEKSIEKWVKKNIKSKFQNCFQCKFFPYYSNQIDYNKESKIFGVNISIAKWYWNKENIEVLTFRCQYLRKRISQSLKVFRTNSCLCFENNKK